jgi:hypothetical protein
MDYESISKKIRSGRKTKALKQIADVFRCEDDEAKIVFDALKAQATGQPMQFVEITLREVTAMPEGWTRNPLMVVPQFMARCGCHVGPLILWRDGDYQIGDRSVSKKDIDQVWKVIPLT